MGFDLSQYATVEERLKLFWDAWPDARITTEIVRIDDHAVLFKASIYRINDDPHPVAVGHAYEEKTDRGVNATSHIENAETSAIGRALANYTFAAGKRPSREEMQKVVRMSGTDLPSTPAVLAGTGGGCTEKQWALLRRLGYVGNRPTSTREASNLIEQLKSEPKASNPTEEEHPF